MAKPSRPTPAGSALALSRRHLRQPPQRIAQPRGRHPLGRREMKRDGLENAHRGGQGASLGPRSRGSEIAGPHPSAAGHARPRQQCRHPRRRHRSRAGRRPQSRSSRPRGSRQGADRALQRAVHDVRRYTVRFRATRAVTRAVTLGAVAMLVRAVGPAAPPHTGALTYVDGQPQIPAAAVPTDDAAALQRMVDRGTTVRLKLTMEARFLPRRRVRQRGRRDSRPRAARRDRRRHRRPPRFVGRRRRRDRRWRRVRGDVGSAADHEEAEPAAAPDRARRALDQRGERRSAAAWPIATSIAPSSRST